MSFSHQELIAAVVIVGFTAFVSFAVIVGAVGVALSIRLVILEIVASVEVSESVEVTVIVVIVIFIEFIASAEGAGYVGFGLVASVGAVLIVATDSLKFMVAEVQIFVSHIAY
jgi:hypothetical protein